MRRVGALALNTFREAIRNKVLHSLLAFALALILSSLALAELSLREEARLTRDLGLAGVDLLSVIIAIFVGGNLLYKELHLRTIHTILSKPVRRWEFILGKYLGMALTLAAEIVLMGLVLAGVLALAGAPPDLALLQALVLLGVQALVVTAMALLFSSFSTPFLSGILTMGLFVVGRSVPDLRLLADRLPPGAGRVLRGLTALLPNLDLFYPSGGVGDGGHVSVHGSFVDAAFMAWTTAYGLGYAALLVLAAMAAFARRDFV